MARSYYTSIDLQKNQLLQAVIQSSGTAPASPIAGQIWYDSTNNQLKVYNGTAWVAYLPYTSSLANIASTTASTSDITASNQKIINLLDPTNLQDAATKNYVDNRVNGIEWKESVRAATTGPLVSTLTGGGTPTVSYPSTTTISITPSSTWTSAQIDGVSILSGYRYLIKDEAASARNGIYVAGSASGTTPLVFTRATDADTTADINGNLSVFVEDGTNNQDTGWTVNSLSANVSWTLGTDPITFIQFTGLGRVVDGDGLVASGNTLNVVGTTDRIAVTSNAVNISPNYVGQGTITTVGALAAGSLTTGFSTVNVAQGGTGAATFTAGYLKASGTTAFTTLSAIPVADVTGAIKKYTDNTSTFTPSGSAPLYTITWTIAAATHGLGANAYSVVEIKRKTATNTYEVVDVDISWNSSTGAVTLTWYVTSNTATSAGDYILTILG